MTSYSFEGAVAFDGHAPETVTIEDGVVTGRLGSMRAKWSVPPHVALANGSLQSRDVVGFTRKYGPLEVSTRYADGVQLVGRDGIIHYPEKEKIHDASVLLTPHKLRSLGLNEAVEETFAFSLNQFAEARDQIRLAWRRDHTVIEVFRQRVAAADFQVSLLRGHGEKVLLRTRLLWDFICLTFLIDYDSSRAKVCANAECDTPYFLQQRRSDKEFCSHRCAVAANNARRAQKKREKR